MTLRLEYTCTEAEMKEAQSLHLRQRYGGGSKWRSRLVLFGFLSLSTVLVWFRFKAEIAPKDRGWFVALFVVIFLGVLFFQRLTQRKRNELVQLEISEQELVFAGGNGRTAMPWSAFAQCLESPTLFSLINRSKTIMWAIPKRAFPDEKSQDWFRSLTKHLDSAVAAAPAQEESVPARFAAKGLTVVVQLEYRDYLARTATSWRTRGIGLFILALIIGLFLHSLAHPPPHPVVPPGQVLLISLAIITPMFTAMFFVVTFISWRAEKKFVKPEQVALSSEGFQFASNEASGHLAWSTYKYYLENRWAFFIWNPQGSLWLMLPKRLFASRLEIEQCRDLLRTNLKQSRWFFY